MSKSVKAEANQEIRALEAHEVDNVSGGAGFWDDGGCTTQAWFGWKSGMPTPAAPSPFLVKAPLS
jgi:hypothetical protein